MERFIHYGFRIDWFLLALYKNKAELVDRIFEVYNKSVA